MEKLRNTYPLSFALVAAFLSVLAFNLFPAWNPSAGFVDTGALRQSAIVALILAVMYLYSGECLLAQFGFEQPSKKLSVMRVLVVTLAAAVVLGVAKVVVQGSVITPPRAAVLMLVAILIATAIFEEILFRGLFFEAFAKTLKDSGSANALIGAALASSVMFGLLHVSSDLGSLFRATAYIQAAVKVLEGTAFGLAMCALYLKTKSVWPAVAAHAAFDLISELPIYLATGVRTSTYITGSPADIVVLALGTAILLPAAKWAWDYLS